MTDLLSHLVDAPLANIFILAGLAFLAIAVLGKISDKIEPGNGGRVMAGVLGAVLIVGGVYTHASADAATSHGNSGVTQASPPDNREPKPPPSKSGVPRNTVRMTALEVNTNRQGHDLSNFEVADAEACSRSCLRDSRCKAMTYVMHGGGAAGGVCWLKDEVSPMGPANGMISSVKTFQSSIK